jgi:hypothetical protein
MEDLIGAAVVSVVGFAAKRTAKWGIVALKKKGVNVPTWVERAAPGVIGTVAGFGAAGAEEMVSERHGATAWT